MPVLNKNTQFLGNGKPNSDKKAAEDKTMNFSKDFECYLQKE